MNLGDTYASLNGGSYTSTTARVGSTKLGVQRRGITTEVPEESLCMNPARFAIEMIRRGWMLRNTIIWHKPNSMPSSVTDRFTVDFEYLFLFVKSKRCWFQRQSEDGVDTVTRNKRCVWTINTKPFPEAHFAVYPEELVTIPTKAGCPNGGVVMDPFVGSGTTMKVAKDLRRSATGIELNQQYIDIIKKRLNWGSSSLYSIEWDFNVIDDRSA